jgi:hypothetical protein
MRITSKAAGLVVAMAATLVLAGCVQPPPTVIPTADPTSKPVFKTDADALAAAKSAFTDYVSASDAVAHAGGTTASQLGVLDTPTQLARDEKTFKRMSSLGERTTGTTAVSQVRLQSTQTTSIGRVRLSIYVCMDISGTRLVDAAGHTVSGARPSDVPLIASFVNSAAGSNKLLFDGSVKWQGTNFCS